MSTAPILEESETPPPAPSAADRLSWSAIFDYVAPTFGVGFMFLLLSIYILKFATDVLGMSAAVMGMILLQSRKLCQELIYMKISSWRVPALARHGCGVTLALSTIP